MPSSAARFKCFLALWLLGFGTGRAQMAAPLKLKSDRMQYARSVEQQAVATRDSLLLAEAWYLYGKTYVFAGDYRTAHSYFMKSLRVQEPRGDSYELSRLYVRLSENEDRLGHTQTALQYAARSLQIAGRLRSDRALIRSYGALGHIYEVIWASRPAGNRQSYTRSLTFYKKREYLCYKLNDTLGIAEVSGELGTLYAQVKDPRAVGYLKNSLTLFTLINKENNRVKAMLSLAAAYLTFGKPKLAFQTLQQAQKFYNSKKLSDYDIQLLLERKHVDYFRAVGQWKAAFGHLEKLSALERNQLMADNNGAIARLNVEYETEKKEARFRAQNRELALDAQTLQTQQRFTLAMSALFVLATGMSLVFFRLYRKNQRISRQNEELVKEQNHRVKNNLQVVSSLLSLQSRRLTDEAAKKAVEESRLRVESMAILHRRLYDGDRLARVSVDEFIRELVGGVLNSYGYYAVRPQFSIDDSMLSADKAVPFGLILNELITNACKYAFPATDDPQLKISCRRIGKKLQLHVTDNGPGLEGPGLERSDVSGPGRTDARLDRSDVAGAGLTHTQEGRTGDTEDGPDGTAIYTARTTTFGMQLIQTQVEQLHGSGRFSVGHATDATGTIPVGAVFTLKFTV